MKIEKLIEILSHLNPETELRLRGWKEHVFTSRYAWESESLDEKHITFSRNADDKLTVHIEIDV